MVKVRRIGAISFDQLDAETKGDVVASIAVLTEEDEDEVRVGLENGTSLNLVTVDPFLIYDPSFMRGDDVVKAYAGYWRDGDIFPPIVIDSSTGVLYEGRHRSAAAVKAKVKAIEAIDLAGVKVSKKDGCEIYTFK